MKSLLLLSVSMLGVAAHAGCSAAGDPPSQAGFGAATGGCEAPATCFEKCRCESGNPEQCTAVCGTCVAPECSECGSCFQQCMCLTDDAATCSNACGQGGSGGAGSGGTPGSGGGPAGTGGTPGGTGGASGSAGTGGVGPGGAGGATSCANDGTAWNPNWQAFECQVFDLTNQRRAQGATCGGVPYPPAGPLTMQPQLRQSARGHAQDMGDNNFFDHTNLQGQDPFDRMRAAGFQGRTMGENIAAGQSSPASVVNGWMNSPGHCKNIMQGAYRFIGVGYYNAPSGRYRHLWVQNFGG